MIDLDVHDFLDEEIYHGNHNNQANHGSGILIKFPLSTFT